ncbi:uncharacterized protein LOC132798802 isoform X1 [Drosophila nasuta]|uniref:uncharacterized protein LOC132798802 isoform X1 n=1 Tax=Drosophila nasuta TaxID=42062 RepID=UPI00295EA950|nr:uncharacterized protein LOC132798802 isoform X1 [Drosophila nasuta]
MRRGLIVFGILIIWMTIQLRYNEAVIFKLTNAVCKTHNRSWVSINKCRLRAIARNKAAFYFNASFLQPTKNIFLEAQILKRASGFKPWLYKFSLDCCRFLKKSYNPVAIIMYNLYSGFSNLNHTCPYEGDQIIDGFYPRYELLHGLPLPTGDYLLEMTWLFYNKPQFLRNVYFQFTEDL